MKPNRHLHPSNTKLEAWVEGEQPQLDEHVEACLRCAGRAEELVGGDDAVSSLRQALFAATEPPSDLKPRIADGIGRKMQARQDWSLVGDLMGVSWRTMRVLSQGTGLHE